MTRWAIVVDLNRCVGCQTCTAACKHRNATAPGVQWRKVLDFEAGSYPDVRRAFLPVGCMHCDEPPCLEVCPSTATRKRADGIVTIDYDICLGCAYCAVACPYQARSKVTRAEPAYGRAGRMRHEEVRFDPRMLGVAQKCTLCADRIDAGLAAGLTPGEDVDATPACVASCISGALSFGDLDDPDSRVAHLLRDHRHFTLHEELGTGPAIHYLYAAADAPDPGPARDEPDATGQRNVAPRLQTSWDWRAAGNFICGGAGTGLVMAASVAAWAGAPVWRLAGLLGLALVALGLFFVWLEIGRPWRFMNVWRNPRSSWMTREAMAAIALFALELPALWFASPPLATAGAVAALTFLYAQGRILRAARGIPAWRHPLIVPLILVTGLTEGAGLLAVLQAGTAQVVPLMAGLAALVLLRLGAWRSWRRALGRDGAPVDSLAALDRATLALDGRTQLGVLLLILAALLWPPLGALAGLAALVTGWRFKFVLITRAAHTQGYALPKMPARGAGAPAPGIRPGWISETGTTTRAA